MTAVAETSPELAARPSKRVRSGRRARTAVRELDALWPTSARRAFVSQALFVAVLVVVVSLATGTLLTNLARLGIRHDPGLLSQPAGFDIGETPIAYTQSDSYGRALLVGLVNTVRAAVASIFVATTLGVAWGIWRLSRDRLMRRMSGGLVDIVRGAPVLIIMFAIYGVLAQLPGPRGASPDRLGILWTSRGVYLPEIADVPPWSAAMLSASVAVLVILAWRRLPRFWMLAALLASLSLLLCGATGVSLSVPRRVGFQVEGGYALSAEFFAVVAAVGVSASAFMAELVRGAVEGVSLGQTEAALSLGLRRWQVLRLIVAPQAFRVLLPPATSLYLDIVKGTALGVAVGYADLVSVGATILGQTSQVLVIVSLFAAAYLALNLSIVFGLRLLAPYLSRHA